MRLFKIICLLTISIYYNLQLAAQEKHTYILNGYLGVQGGESFHYDLELQDSTANYLKGFAYTYNQKSKDVKATVVAKIDRSNKTLQIQEFDIVYNKGFTSIAVICLLESSLSINENNQLNGSILTKIDGGAGLPCSKGSLLFSNYAEIEELFYGKKTVPVKDTVQVHVQDKKPKVDTLKPKIYIDKTKPQQVQNTVIAPKKREITEGKDEVIVWESGEIELLLWDGTAIDGDVVSVLYNGNMVLTSYSLIKEPKKILLPIGNNELNIITIVAESEGGEPPNTANILLKDGKQEYPILAYNKMGKRAIIKVKKKI